MIEISDVFGISVNEIPIDRLIDKEVYYRKKLYENPGGFDLTYQDDIQKYMNLK